MPFIPVQSTGHSGNLRKNEEQKSLHPFKLDTGSRYYTLSLRFVISSSVSLESLHPVGYGTLLPIKKLKLLYRAGSTIKHQNNTVTSSKVRVSGKIFPGIRTGRSSNTFHPSTFRELLRINEILKEGKHGLVNIWVNLMGHWRPDFRSEPHPDIPADLTYPDRFSFKAHWTQPGPKMVTLMYSVARFLPGKILLSFIEIERTDG
jgi:hypothetical protein